ncbi:sex-determining region Y protein-like [Musca domestica]|uniref:Sex-determining region Y protein-like n=1 Tax=Musca domestica TaxID=7370 RepID=A0ABM3UMF6_MUSDO|nr:sex-determining region Y protein-like [Musca domestica]XP_058974716.1 sex-determining region Y protein-like [Musca domestica]
MEIERESPTSPIAVSQRENIKHLLQRYGMENCRDIATPLEPNHQVACFDEKCRKADQLEYQSLIGSLMYLEFHYGTHHNQQQQGQYNFEQYRHAGQYNNHGQYNYSGKYNQQLQSYQNNRYHPYLLHQQRKKELHRSQQQQLDQQQEQHNFHHQQYQTNQQQYNINEQQSQYHHHQQMENIEGNEQQHYNQQQYQTSQQQQMDNHKGNEQNIQQQMSERKRQSYVFMY